MNSMNISLPDRLKSFVEKQVNSGRFSSPSEYIRELIEHDEHKREQEELESMLLDGLHSGEPTEMTSIDWTEIREQALRKLEERRSHRLP